MTYREFALLGLVAFGLVGFTQLCATTYNKTVQRLDPCYNTDESNINCALKGFSHAYTPPAD